MSAQALLERLEGVREKGRGQWVARCPAHPDKSPSLSVRELPDGRVLLHCFAQCGAVAVLEAVGLSWGDLFPEKLEPGEPQRVPASWALEVLAFEAAVAGLIAADVAEGKALSPEDADRACVAAGRIAAIAERARGG